MSSKRILSKENVPSGIKNNVSRSDTISYILPDFRAANILRRNFDTLVRQRQASYSNIEICGFEIYMVEQWICERRIGTIITSFTGNKDHKLLAVKLTVQKNSALWPIRFKKYINELIKSQHAKLKNCADQGFIFITNINSFYNDSNLNIKQIDPIYSESVMNLSHNLVPFPMDYPKFEANFDLKRIDCGSRTTLLFTNPNKSSEDKFRSMFKVHDLVPIVFAVKELALLLQIALYFFDCINPNYCDGLLCYKTELAIKKWWKTIGCLFFSSTPTQGGSLTSPSSIAAIISALISCRSRLNLVVTEGINKDPYDIVPFKIAIFQFQKLILKDNQKSWLLDKATVEKLISITNDKIAYDNIFKFKKAVNKTVNDISRRNIKFSTSIGVETTNFDELALNVQGKRLNYLFLGKGNPVQQSNVLLDIYYSQKKYVDSETPIHLNDKNMDKEISSDNVEENRQDYSISEFTKNGETNKFTNVQKVNNTNNAHSNDTIDSVIHNSVESHTKDDYMEGKNQSGSQQMLSQKEYNIITSPKLINFDSPQLREASPSMLTSASNYMAAIKNAANQRKQKINDGLTYVSKPAKNLIGGKRKEKELQKCHDIKSDIDLEAENQQCLTSETLTDKNRSSRSFKSSTTPNMSKISTPLLKLTSDSSLLNRRISNTKNNQTRTVSNGSDSNENYNSLTASRSSFVSKASKLNERAHQHRSHRPHIHHRDKDKSNEKKNKSYHRHSIRLSKNKNIPLMILNDEHFEKDNPDEKTSFVLPNDSSGSFLRSVDSSSSESLTKQLHELSFDNFPLNADDGNVVFSDSEIENETENDQSYSGNKEARIENDLSKNKMSNNASTISNDLNTKFNKKFQNQIDLKNYTPENAATDRDDENGFKEDSADDRDSLTDEEVKNYEENADFESSDDFFDEGYDSDVITDDYEDGSSIIYRNICNSSMEAIVDEDVYWGSKVQKRIYNNFEKISHRRMSIPINIHDFNLKILDYDYHPIRNIIRRKFDFERKADDIQTVFTKRKKSYSFSKIEEVVLKVNRQLTEECVLKKYLMMKMKDIEVYENIKDKTYFNTDDSKMVNKVYVLDETQKVTSELPLPKLMQNIQLFQQVLSNRLEFIYKNLANAVQFKRVYDAKTKELRAQNSKFKYEVRLLKIRTHDVENSNKELLDKIKSLKEMGFNIS